MWSFFCDGYGALGKTGCFRQNYTHHIQQIYTKPNWRCNHFQPAGCLGCSSPWESTVRFELVFLTTVPGSTGNQAGWTVGAQVRMLVHENSKTKVFNGRIFENRLRGLVRVGSSRFAPVFTLVQIPLSAAPTTVQVNLYRYAHNHNGPESGWLYIVYVHMHTITGYILLFSVVD